MQTVEKKSDNIKRYAKESPCLCFNFRRAARAVTQIYDELFKSIQLTSSQVSILNALSMVGEMTVMQLADCISTDRTTITRSLRPLSREGLLKVQPGRDKRTKIVIITDKGRGISMKSMDLWEEFQVRLVRKVGKHRTENLCREICQVIEDIKKI